MATWSSERIKRVLSDKGWEYTWRPIQYGEQFKLSDGTYIDCYSSGKVVVHGKKTPLQQDAREIFSSGPPTTLARGMQRRERETGASRPASVDNGHDAVASNGLKQVDAFTDGACIGNPGPGGYGVVLRHGSHHRELSGGYRRTTNNRMEILAAVTALGALKEKCQVRLYSDSQYLVRAMREGWPRRWQANGWMRSSKEKAVNPDLWGALLQLCDQHEVEFIWVKGHAGHAENERCDRLAMQAAQQPNLLVDKEYEGARTVAQRSVR